MLVGQVLSLTILVLLICADFSLAWHVGLNCMVELVAVKLAST